jgi:LPXTG-site transpeptidase (sortase) family protein
MASDSDTLNIGSLRLRKEYPIAQVQAERPADPVNHPKAAEAARARIAALKMEPNPILHPDAIPAAPTADLITNKTALKEKLDSLGTVSGPQIPSAMRPILTAVGIFALVLLLFKSPVILSQVSYSLGHKPAPTTSVAPAASAVIPAENTITIPKINVHAPVEYEPSIQEANIQKALQSGVVHYGNTALPGQVGNAAIFGHSSNDWWEPGDYKFVFVLLDKLAPGDRFTIDYQSKRYTYEVTGSKVVEPTDLSVLNPTPTPTVTLITCTPPGTSLRRLVVTAKQVDPDPSGAAASTATPQAKAQGNGNLPSSAPGFFTQVKNAWDGVVHGFKSLFGADDSPNPSASPSPGATPDGGQLPTAK